MAMKTKCPTDAVTPAGQGIHCTGVNPMAQPIELASGPITPADSLTIELLRPSDMPPAVLIRWPQMPSITDPRKFTAVANAAMRVLAQAVTKLASIKADREL